MKLAVVGAGAMGGALAAEASTVAHAAHVLNTSAAPRHLRSPFASELGPSAATHVA